MKYIVRSLLLFILILSPPVIYAQQDVLSEFIVDGPRISRTAFTNWDKIELTYTLRYMEGYEPVYENMKAENMNFSPLEVDPDYADKPLDKRNERVFRKENYVDLVYHLRQLGEKKGDIVIAQQLFSYRKIQVGKQKTEWETKQFKTDEFLLKYDTVLTKGADEIKDKIELGSFSNRAWTEHRNGLISFGFLSFLALFLIFRKPTLDLAGVSVSKTKPEVALAVKLQDQLAFLSSASDQLIDIQIDNPDFYNRVARLHEACRGVMKIYVPDMTDAFTTPQIGEAIKLIEFPWLRDKLMGMYKEVYLQCEGYLYESERGLVGPDSAFASFFPARFVLAKEYSVRLRSANVARQKKMWIFRQKIDRLKRVFRWK